ncbi:MAG: hypothetical protein EHM42_05485 [Planctomycetaceae bacterium]|nr:MAG: hypothetical protein EHM42_05485 [Planctomycetaceae bacterium]
MPPRASQALHGSQLLPSVVLGLGTGACIVTGGGGPIPAANIALTLLFGLAVAVSVAVPMWCGVRYDERAPSRVAGALRALGIWFWFQGFLLALCLVLCGLLLDRWGVWPDRNIAPPGPPGIPAGPMI